ncbi:hypothetical protein PS838_05988 [Pseudomonas fluorescens]|nr:hypothetical protein PS838_05988 [Pseudomonas fluorescens]
MDSTQQILSNAYRNVLTGLPQHWLDRGKSHDVEYAKLSRAPSISVQSSSDVTRFC